MYPNAFFSLIPPFPRTKRVFVAMSFDSRFDQRWNDVLAPAVRLLRHGGQQLEPFRVDLSSVGDAILTEILTTIADSHCILADITASIEINGRPIRNANVLYEVGFAQASRLPEEVIVVRSDERPLDFDIAGVRVHSYRPDDNPADARQFVADTIVASLGAFDARRRTSLRAASERLTLPAASLLMEALNAGRINHPETKTVIQMLGSVQRSEAISLLLELGAIRADLIRVTPEFLKEKGDDPAVQLLTYVPTPFGGSLLELLADTMGVSEPGMQEHMEALMPKRPDGDVA